MSVYRAVVTAAGLDLRTRVALGSGTLVYTDVKRGSGVLGATDPETLTDIITPVQTFDVVDVRLDSAGHPYVFWMATNAGVVAPYLARELGVFGRAVGDVSDTLIAYLYAATDEDAEAIAPPTGGIAQSSAFRLDIPETSGVDVTVTVDGSIVYLDLDRWSAHFEGVGGVDQHPLATGIAPGMMSAADKAKVDAHIDLAAPTTGVEVHGVATGAVAGFMAAADKSKLDGMGLLPYYAVRILDGYVAVGTVLAQTNLRNCGMHISPKGGVNLLGSATSVSWVVLEMRVNNVTAGTLNRTLHVPYVSDTLHYQIDNGAITQILTNGANGAPTISVPAGIHIVRFYVRMDTSTGNQFNLADWLDGSIVWASGGTYY